MIIRAVDGNHDWEFGKGLQNYNRKNDAIAENVQTRLLSFINDCFFDMGAGIDWFRLLSKKKTLDQIRNDCKAQILGSFGVVQVNSIKVEAGDLRNLKLTYDIDTIYTRRFSQNLEVISG